MSAVTCTLGALLLATVGASATPGAAGDAAPKPDVPREMRCLLEAYPDHVCEARPDAVVLCDGTVLPWDDGRTKDHETTLNEADLQDQLSQRYPRGRFFSPDAPPPVDFDPGRIRHEPLFRKMYGDSRKEVAKTLGRVRWLPSTVDRELKVTTINGVDRALQRVSDDLEKLPADIRKYVEKTGGTFVWRKIRKTDRQSCHSFAMAIDVGVAYSDFWRWRKRGPDGKLRFRNRIPHEIVEVFERHGFIWGGKWYHFDTMHFEYRPELLHPACVDDRRPSAPAE